MKTDLPEPAEYYRATRARELRETAARLERWAGGPAKLQRVQRYPGVFGCLSVTFTAPVLIVAAIVARHSVILPIAVGLAAAPWVPGILFARAERLRAEADRVEAEHAARYGVLPDEVS